MNEITVRTSLQIRKGNLFYQSQPTTFLATQNGDGGPVPGQLLIGTGGVNINFAPLTQPSIFRIQNLDTINFIEFGVWDADISKFVPLCEVLPGESYICRVSRKLGTVYPATGTGSPGAPIQFHIRANHAPCNVLLECFEY
jgi:hypothetical protein